MRSLAVLCLSFASLSLVLSWFILGTRPSEFFISNLVPIGTRLAALGLSWVGGLVVALVVFGLARFSQDASAARLAVARLVSPLTMSCFVPVLFEREAWVGREAAFLCYLLVVGLALERLGRIALTEHHRLRHGSMLGWSLEGRAGGWLLRWLPLVLTLALIGAYVARIGNLTQISHMKLATMSSDLAEYDNLFFNALHGHPFRSPAIAGHLDDWNTLQGHAEFGLYMLLPFYVISPGAHALLWIQTCVVALTALPIYLLGASRLGRFGGLCFAIAYLLMPAVQQPNFYDFHFTPLGMFFVTWVLCFLTALSKNERSRGLRTGVYVSMALALLCREDISIGLAVAGTYLILSGTLVKDGFIVVTVAGLYFVTMKFGVMPLFGTWWFDTMYEDLKAQGAKGFGAVVLTLLSNPSYVIRTMLTEPKFLYLLHMTVPLLALWLRRPLLWLAVLTAFVSSLLVTNRPPMHQISFQYSYIWLPYVVAASVIATRKGLAGWSTLGAVLFTASAMSHQMGIFPTGERIIGGFGVKTFKMTPADTQRYQDLQAIVAKIPRDATVVASEAEGPHLSARLVMYSLKYTLGPYPDYILVGHVGGGSEAGHLRQALQSGRYGVVAQQGQFVLARKGADPRNNAPLWSRIGERQPQTR